MALSEKSANFSGSCSSAGYSRIVERYASAAGATISVATGMTPPQAAGSVSFTIARSMSLIAHTEAERPRHISETRLRRRDRSAREALADFSDLSSMGLNEPRRSDFDPAPGIG
jgi:hypothetical protein